MTLGSVAKIIFRRKSGSRYPPVRRYCKRKTTLQSPAIRVYLGLIQDENKDGAIDEASLRRDLRRLKAWEDADQVYTRLKKEYAASGAQYHL